MSQSSVGIVSKNAIPFREVPVRTPDRPTIADVAAAAGVGVGTVSRVLNGGVNVRESTRLKVLEVIERLGYRPSHLAAALSRGTPRTVAILVPHLTRPSTVARLAGALAVLDEQGYDTIVCNVDTPQQRDHHLAALTARHRADGVIVVSVHLARQHLAAFGRAAIPLVTVDVTAAGVPRTIIDDVAGGRLATAHLLGLGHRRIGFVGDATASGEHDLGFGSSKRRLRGYRQELAAANIYLDPELVRLGPHGPAVAAELADQLLGLPEPPTAIFAASDTQAIGVLSAAERRGFGVPGRLSVVGFDDIESAALLNLSTVRQPLERSGAEGARRLCALLHGITVRPLRQLLPLRIVRRSSSAAPGRAGPGPAAPGPAGQGLAGQGLAGQGHAAQGHAAQGHAAQGHAGQRLAASGLARPGGGPAHLLAAGADRTPDERVRSRSRAFRRVSDIRSGSRDACRMDWVA
jgi:DNA-binding LacI/PurR family transcriptional regulator